MKRTFSGYYKDKDLVDVLCTNDIVIVLDSSVLCNLYGLEDDVWKPIVEILDKKRDCLWLPYNMADIYHKGIITILVNKIQLLLSLKNRLLQTTELLGNLPFTFSDSKNFEELSKKISFDLSCEIVKIRQRGKKDSEIREAISRLYDKRVGISKDDPDPSSFRISSYNEVKEINALSGRNFSVETTNSTESESHKVADPNDIILHTLIKLSKDKKKNVLYVISEPSDYWSIFIDKTSYGPNPEHQTYFKRDTNGHNFYCCTFASFMQKLSLSQKNPLPNEIMISLKKLSYGTMIQNDES